MGFRTDRVWFDITLADRKPIPTPALPLKGRGKSPGWKEDSSPPRPLVDLGRGVKAIKRCGEGQRHAAAVAAHDCFTVRPAVRRRSAERREGKGCVSQCRARGWREL